MAIVLMSPLAQRDMAQIYNHVAIASNKDRAIALLAKIRQRVKTLASNPGMGRLHDMLQPEVRGFPSGNYMIFYRTTHGGVLVLRVLHGARDVPAVFWES